MVGPGNFSVIISAIGAAVTQQPELSAPTTLSTYSLADIPTFPIVVAFYIVGLNPNLPKALDFELPVRKLAHQLAYIPKNMDRIFNYMRFSQFDLPEDKVTEAYTAADPGVPKFDGDDLKPIQPLFDRVVVLYAEAAALSGDINLHDTEKLVQQLDLDPFKQYRNEIQGVGGNLQASIRGCSTWPDCRAATGKGPFRLSSAISPKILKCSTSSLPVPARSGVGRISDDCAQSALPRGFRPVPRSVDPILRVFGAAAVILLIAYEIAANTWLGNTVRSSIPPTTAGILYLLFTILFVHAFAIGQALYVRARLIASDDYFSETGRGNPVVTSRSLGDAGTCRCYGICCCGFSTLPRCRWRWARVPSSPATF